MASPGHLMTLRRLCLALGALVAVPLCGPAQALDRQVRIVNDTSLEIVALYGARSGASTPRNILSEATIPSRSALEVDLEDGSGYCVYDLRAVFDDGSELSRDDVNVCEVGTYRYTD
jgi:hypothetical protein